ncbi:alpha/beta fold hydrolase [Kribbella pittospori]|uniref:Alpha/beta fold hydrolase n=1 Tax=Kribbella pittospori TaxID=722689 RepID=A0A4R0KVW5_9ACTN|nr:alpha/beta fold hydrolase [Kribbella pittospori]TCC64227.1 alpha/beta fold hydrolase [Kribbella pittospori]
MRRLRALGLLATGVVVAAGLTPVATAPPATAEASIDWTTCANPGLQDAGAECALVPVPLDYAKPGGATIRIAVSRIKHTVPDAQAQGVMLVNPGGPGGSGLALSTLGQAVPNGAGGYYDWIGFDPRGVGSSQPSLSCDPDYFGFNRPTYLPVLKSTVQTWLGRAKGYADACKANGPILSHMTTIDSARDVDSIRAALGVERINYYGFSYGTYLGQVYSTLFPSRVRRMVLDSNVDPRNVFYQANLNQDVAFDRNIKIWFGWLATYDRVYHLGTTEKAVERLFYETEAKLTFHPADGKIGGDEWVDTFLLTGYFQSTWTDLGDTFARYVNAGDVSNLVDHYLGASGLGNDNFYAVYSAVQCTDVQWPQKWSTWERDNWLTFAKAPYETWANAWYNSPCLYWPAPAHKPLEIDGSKVGNVLLIDQTLDAPTPFEGSLEVRRRYPHSSLIALPGGTSHASSLSGNACLDNQVAAYLTNGTLPPRKPGPGPDTTCAPLPQPVPGAAVAGTTVTSTQPVARRGSGFVSPGPHG